MKTKMIFALLGLPLVLLSFKKEDKAKVLVYKTNSACDTAFLYPVLVVKQAGLNPQTSVKSLTVTDESSGSRAKLQMKAYLDSLTIDGSPAASNTVKKEVKIKTTEQQKHAGNSKKTNNLSRNANRVQKLNNRIASDQSPIPYDPDDVNPMQSSAGSK